MSALETETAKSVRTRPRQATVDAATVAARQLRSLSRQPAAVVPSLIVPLLFYAVQRGALDDALTRFGVENPANFFIPVTILMAASTGGLGLTLVTDVQSGYLDKLLLTGVGRNALLLGSMAGDLVRSLGQTAMVAGLGLLTGGSLNGGLVGLGALLALSAGWTLAYGGIGYAIALRSGNAEAVQGSNMLFFPFVFFSTGFMPADALSGWLATISVYNPVTYLLAGMRGALDGTLDAATLGQAATAVTLIAALTLPLAVTTMASRTSR